MENEQSQDFVLPKELMVIFDKKPKFKTAFEGLSLDRQKVYCDFFNGTSESENITRRIGRYKSRIMDGLGMSDCNCGLSKNMPLCDGSHKYG